jgi:hypothetical protein
MHVDYPSQVVRCEFTFKIQALIRVQSVPCFINWQKQRDVGGAVEFRDSLGPQDLVEVGNGRLFFNCLS